LVGSTIGRWLRVWTLLSAWIPGRSVTGSAPALRDGLSARD
jgi:hypothetical protein